MTSGASREFNPPPYRSGIREYSRMQIDVIRARPSLVRSRVGSRRAPRAPAGRDDLIALEHPPLPGEAEPDVGHGGQIAARPYLLNTAV